MAFEEEENLTPEPTEPVEEVQEPYKTFSTEEEYQAELEGAKQKWEADAKNQIKEEVPQATPKEVQRIFEENWKPKDWNDFAEQLLSNPNALNRLQQKIVPETAQALQNMAAKEQQEKDEINKGFDKEYNDLAKQGKLPPLNSEEGKKLDAIITQFGLDNEIYSIKKAYDLWSKTPQDKGGGLEYLPPAKQKLNEQKKKSGLVGGSRGGSPGKKGLSYDKIHNQDLDSIIDNEIG